MMKLHINIGAIVYFGLTCETNLISTGKVIEINDDEVVIVKQEYVAEDEYNPSHGCLFLNRTISIDSTDSPIHIDRALIGSWMYYAVPHDRDSVYYGVYQPEDVNRLPIKRLNIYDEDGFCKGTSNQEDFN